MTEKEIELIIKALEEYQSKLNKENLKLNNLTLFSKNVDSVYEIVKLKEKLKNEKPYIYTINGEEVTREELIKYLFENTGDHIPRID